MEQHKWQITWLADGMHNSVTTVLHDIIETILD